MATTAEITTAEQLLQAPDLGPCELVRGELIMVSPAGYAHGSIAGRITRALANFVEAKGLGDVLSAEPGFLIARDPDTVRAPDVAFVRADRIPAGEKARFFEGAPDLAVEVLSPNDRASEVNAKVQDWLDAGCPMVWVVDPATRTVSVYRGRTEIAVLGATDTLSGGDVLPGFTLPVADILTRQGTPRDQPTI
ncbi:MAG TPA: Uma2 family endonuclease [Planctomycetota bacterium]|nr:Uma2 family endonuclease [Planctomycetota bacterium]